MQISDRIITQGFIIYRFCIFFFLFLFGAIINQMAAAQKCAAVALPFNCVYTELCHLFQTSQFHYDHGLDGW